MRSEEPTLDYCLITESDLVKVYTLNGVLLKQGKRDEIINSLPRGVYVVNGKKLIVR